jgi:hypothetical protein
LLAIDRWYRVEFACTNPWLVFAIISWLKKQKCIGLCMTEI